jgi:twitching motility two-component system response regulator PilG
MSTKIFKVALLGVNKYDQQVLSSIFWLSNNRTRIYRLAALQEGVDMAVVDANYPADLRQRLHAQYPRLPIINVGDAAEGAAYVITKPLIASRVLRILDQVTIQVLAYAPDLVIGQANGVNRELSQTFAGDLGERRSATAKRVLVVDDSLAVRKLMELELRIHRLVPDFAETAAQAFDKLSQGEYDLVFLDVVLPDLDGYQICRTLKQNARKRAMPVVMLTSKSSPFDRIRGKLAGCSSYLTKPVSHEQLNKVITQYLGKSQPETQPETQPALKPAAVAA